MHPAIASLVSSLFYSSNLVTPAAVGQLRLSVGLPPLIWINCASPEQTGKHGKSYVNPEQAACAASAAMTLREAHPKATIAVITMYKGQLLEIMSLVPVSSNIEVLTVDSCQGSEFEYVVLSTVRANAQRSIGFVKEPQRICVAISRSMQQLIIVGDSNTMSSNSDWSQVVRCSQQQRPSQWARKSSDTGES